MTTQLIAPAREDLRLWDAIGKPRALELIAALEAMQWRPIETAPKDEMIDIWLTGGPRWCDCYYDRICDEWRTSRPSGRLLSIKSAYVSYWMPRPNPPQAPEAAQEADHE